MMFQRGKFTLEDPEAANALCRVCDIAVDSKRRRVDSSRRLVVVGGGVAQVGSDSKILQLDDRDRISNLPQDVIHCILEFLSVHDAARTSVLSKEWRYKWGMNTRLVLDKLFFSQLTSNKDKEAHQSVFLRAIEMIILVHIGPILSFNLYIPPKLNQCPVPRWIEHFLNKGIRELELTNSEKNAFEIPSRLFDCEELVELKLTAWILTPPLKFGSFNNLIKVKLMDISIIAEVSFGSQLRQLYLGRCTGIQHLGCQFTNGNNLTKLFLDASEQIEWQWFEFTKQLKDFGLAWTTTNNNTRKSINLIKHLSTVSSITKLFLSGYTVEVLGPHPSMLKGLAPKIENVTFLCLVRVRFYNLCQLSNSVCLIKCLPNLQTLAIVLEPGVKSLNPTMLTIEHYSESLDLKGMLLDKLHTVTIHCVVGTIAVLHFIKVLLASSPSLRVMSLFLNNKVNYYEEREKIRQELQQCPKKSLAVQLII